MSLLNDKRNNPTIANGNAETDNNNDEDPKPVGRLSPLGIAMTVVEGSHLFSLCILLPMLVLDRVVCSCGDDATNVQDNEGQCSTLQQPQLPAVIFEIFSSSSPSSGLPKLQESFCSSTSLSALGSSSVGTTVLFWWLVAELIFYLAMKWKLVYWLQSIDPQEAHFHATGCTTMTVQERRRLWDRVMQADKHDMTGYFESWFSGRPIEEISLEEFRDFVAWGYFDNRNIEHLNPQELEQLSTFAEEAIHYMRIQKLKGEGNGDLKKGERLSHTNLPLNLRRGTSSSFGTESTRTLSTRTSSSDHDNIGDEEEDSSSVASWIPCQARDPRQRNTKDNIERRLELHKSLFHNPLSNTQRQSTKPEPSELAQMMRCITKLSDIKSQQQQQPKIKKTNNNNKSNSRFRFMRPTADPILGVRIFPLILHLVVFLTTEMPGRVLFWMLGFQRYKIGSIAYYYRPAARSSSSSPATTTPSKPIPLVFIHGIGVGPIVYLPLLLQLIWTTQGKRSIFVPEVVSVSAFRPWILPQDALTPQQVVASISLMLASKGCHQATFVGHSFGTFWMTYLIKYTPPSIRIAGVVFLDPVNFCLKNATLTRRVVYNRPDPGDIGYMIKTDMMVNWSIQRNFSWTRGNLFVEDLLVRTPASTSATMDGDSSDSGDNSDDDDASPVTTMTTTRSIPCVVFLSGKDKTAPSKLQLDYLLRAGGGDFQGDNPTQFCLKSAKEVSSVEDFLHQGGGNSVVVFPDCDHGLWMLDPFQNLPKVAASVEAVTRRIEKQQH